MRALRERLTFANVVSCLALFVALGGASYAAIQLPKNSVGTRQLKKGAVTKAKIKKSTIRTLRGARGPTGPVGPVGPAGGTLPAGVTLRGTFALGFTDSTTNSKHDRTAVSFGGYALSQRPVVNLVLSEFPAVTPPRACPGTPSAPEAEPGNLCIYVVQIAPNSGGDFFVGDPTAPDPPGVKFNIDTQVTTPVGDGRASLVGFMASHTVTATTGTSAFGTWAVTGEQ